MICDHCGEEQKVVGQYRHGIYYGEIVRCGCCAPLLEEDNMDDDFDFIKAFADVDLLQVEAVGKVVGRVIAAVFMGMVEAGMSPEDSRFVIRTALAELSKSLTPKKEGS